MTVGTGLELPLRYKGVMLDVGYKLDVVVNSTAIVEIKTVSSLMPVHKAQLLTYLRLTGYPVGLLLNFNVPLMKNGVTRVLNTKTERHRPQSRSRELTLCVTSVAPCLRVEIFVLSA